LHSKKSEFGINLPAPCKVHYPGNIETWRYGHNISVAHRTAGMLQRSVLLACYLRTPSRLCLRVFRRSGVRAGCCVAKEKERRAIAVPTTPRTIAVRALSSHPIALSFSFMAPMEFGIFSVRAPASSHSFYIVSGHNENYYD